MAIADFPAHSYTSTRDNELILSWLQLANFLLFHVPEVWKRYPFRVAPFRFLIVCFNRIHAKACKSEDDDDGDMKWRNMILMMNILRPEKSASQFFWQNSIEGIKWIRSDRFWWWITKWVLYSGSMKLFPAKIAERATLQNLWRQRVTAHCYPRLLTDDRRYRQVEWISS